MAIALPYAFDTLKPWRAIMKGVLGLALFLIAGIAYSLAFGSLAVAIQLSLCIALVLAFGIIVLRNAEGSVGTIGRRDVVVEPPALYFFRFAGPSGIFPLDRFTAVRVEQVSGSFRGAVPLGSRSRVYLAGVEGTPRVLVARVFRGGDVGTRVGLDFASALHLPYGEERKPY
jgi:hypothetical protein